MSTILLAAVAVIVCIFFQILKVQSQPQKPLIWCGDSKFLDNIQKIAPILTEHYIPTRLWGFSGHAQTILHSIIGKINSPFPKGQRYFLTLQDGTTLTYDMFQPSDNHLQDDVTIAICPGICNTSESVYVRTFVHWAQYHGYRCVVLNHVGVLKNVPVTGPRIFNYGDSEDYQAMIRNVVVRYPETKVVCVGFSLGGNIITVYLGDNKPKPSNIVGGVAVCQGYSGLEHTQYLLSWQNCRRFYLYIMTENLKSTILRHRKMLLSEELKKRYNLNEHEIASSATLPELDEAYSRRIHRFNNLTEYYERNSSRRYFEGIKVPMIFLNASDDPIVPTPLLEPVKKFTMERNNSAFVEVAHGGHLAFYEGGFIYPNSVTWLDRTLLALVECVKFTSDEMTKSTRSLSS